MAHLELTRPAAASIAAPAEALATRRARRFRPPPGVIGWTVLAALAVAGLVAWEAASNAGTISPIFYPPPSQIYGVLQEWFTTGEWQEVLLPTFGRVLVGFTLGATIGTLVGLISGFSPGIYRYTDVIVSALHPIPKVSLLPLAMLLLGFGERSYHAVIALSAFFPMMITVTAGVRAINPNYLAVARVYRLSRAQMFRRVLLPASLPAILTGKTLALNTAFLITIAIELKSARAGLGRTVWYAWESMRIEHLYASIFLIALIGIGIAIFNRVVQAAFIKWQG